MRVIIRPADVTQPSFRDQVPRHDAGRPDDLLGPITAEIKGVASGIQGNAVHRDLLADIAADDIGIIAALFQVIVQPLGRSVRQVKRLRNIGLDDPLIRVKREKSQVKGTDMVAGLYRNISFRSLAKASRVFPLARM